jgi:hypothetical protein
MKPTRSILDKSFDYTDSASTDVSKRWRLYGWLPKHEVQLPQPRTVVALKLREAKK